MRRWTNWRQETSCGYRLQQWLITRDTFFPFLRNYRPQGKVIFSEVSVSHSVHRVERWSASRGGLFPREGSCIWRGIEGVWIWGRGVCIWGWGLHPTGGGLPNPWYWHLLAATAAVGMQPTGMHSWFKIGLHLVKNLKKKYLNVV